MGEEKGRRQPFHFLTDTEFLALDSKSRAKYLNQAQQALLDERERARLLALGQMNKPGEGD
jgi:hypothetical protein